MQDYPKQRFALARRDDVQIIREPGPLRSRYGFGRKTGCRDARDIVDVEDRGSSARCSEFKRAALGANMTGTSDLILAIVHHLLAFGLAAVLAAEFVLTAPGLTGAGLKRLQRLDRYYAALAGLLIVIGVLRVMYGGKGPDLYLASHAFWAKMAAFAAIGLLSIAPTVRILGWGLGAAGEGGCGLCGPGGGGAGAAEIFRGADCVVREH